MNRLLGLSAVLLLLLAPHPAQALGEDRIIPILLWSVAAQVAGGVAIAILAKHLAGRRFFAAGAFVLGSAFAWYLILATDSLDQMSMALASLSDLSLNLAFELSAPVVAVVPGTVLAIAAMWVERLRDRQRRA